MIFGSDIIGAHTHARTQTHTPTNTHTGTQAYTQTFESVLNVFVLFHTSHAKHTSKCMVLLHFCFERGKPFFLKGP